AFARTGNPGRGDGKRPEWPPWSASPEYLVLDTPAGGGTPTSPKTMTSESVRASLDTDPRYADPRVRCLAYHDLAMWSSAVSRQAYDPKCQAVPFGGHPVRK